METVATSPKNQEKLKSFDILASVNLYRYDLENSGYIKPETKQRVYDEERTYIAEGINRPLRTDFRLQRQDEELVYFHNGKWQPYILSLLSGLEAYRKESTYDPRKIFMADRAVDDLAMGYKMLALKPGEKLKWHSPYAYEESQLYGEKFVADLGFNPQRRMGFLYEAEANPDGSVNLRSQSVDNSEDEAFAAAMSEDNLDSMRQAYDTALSDKYSESFYAGRRLGDEPSKENAWAIIQRHKDLIEDYFMVEIEKLAEGTIAGAELEKAKKRLTYGVWAALKERLDNHAISGNHATGSDTSHEVAAAYKAVAARGEVLFGCGGAMSGEDTLLNARPADVFESIYGRRMTCPFCGDKNQYGDPCSPNQFCTACSAEVKNGEVVSTGRRKNSGGWLEESLGYLFRDWQRIRESVAQKRERQKQESN